MNRQNQAEHSMGTVVEAKHEAEHKQDVMVVKCEREKGFIGIFEIALSGVKHREAYTFIDTVERGHETTVMRHMEPGDTIKLHYAGSNHDPFVWRVQGAVHGDTEAETATLAKCHCENTLLGLHTEGMDYQFRAVAQVDIRLEQEKGPYVVKTTPDYLEITVNTSRAIGFSERTGNIPYTPIRLRLPLLFKNNTRVSNQIPLILQQAQAPVSICCGITCVELAPEVLNHLEKSLTWLQNHDACSLSQRAICSPRLVDEETLSVAQKLLTAWLNQKRGYRYELSVTSNAPIPASLVNISANDLMPMQHVACRNRNLHQMPAPSDSNPSEYDLSALLPVGYAEPLLFPDPRLVLDMDAPRAYNGHRHCPAVDGIRLGCQHQSGKQMEVCINERDRSRHCYILGATGTGKSTLLTNMIIQDIASGQGVTVLDPHGDLFQQLLAHVPDHRLDDLVVVNPADSKHVVGINLLECSENGGPEQIHFNINEMMEIFNRLYHSETMGPMFETYMRTAMLILMDHHKPRTASIMEIVDLFQNRDYRKTMKDACQNDTAVAFWNDTAEKTNGEASLPNMTCYVTSKLNTFIHNRLMRNIVCQSKSTINFRNIMDHRKILLINLSKGALGRLDSQLVGMLILGKMLGAALTRNRLQLEKRAPHFLYIDEFQSFATGTMAHMMSEARKFGLCITLANQNTCQLQRNIDHSQENIMEAILGNVGSLMSFRIGPTDAEVVKKYTAPEISGQDLQYLPDYHVAAKLLINGVPARPFVFETMPCAPRQISRKQIAAIQKSQQRDARPIHLVEEEMRRKCSQVLSDKADLLRSVMF